VLRRPDGTVQRASPTIRLGWSVGSRSERVVVNPHSTYAQAVVLNEWLSFEQLGAYVLTTESSGSTPNGSVGLDRREHRIVVGLRDADALRRRCDDLVKLLPLRRTANSELRTAAAAELMWFRDPSCVACLETAIVTSENPQFFEPLVAVGTMEAKAAIVRLTNNPRDYIAQGARNALARFRLR
jgi:hypothetical protein